MKLEIKEKNFRKYFVRKQSYFSVFFLLVFSFVVTAQSKKLPIVEIAAVGDILLARGVERKIEKFGTDYPFDNIRDLLQSADIAFGNLENPLTDKCEKTDKKYNFHAKPGYAKILRSSGLDVFSLANNHTFDCGNTGLFETFENLEKENLRWVGAGKTDAEGESPIIIKKKGLRIAFLGFTTISSSDQLKTSSLVAFATKEKITHSVEAAKQKAEVVIVSIHWGTEYAIRPNSKQIELAKAAIKAGADAILGHHPHVLQDLNLIQKTNEIRSAIIAYSLGNFVFDSPVGLNKRLSESIILKMRFTKNGLVGTEVIPVTIEKYRPVIANETNRKIILSRLNYFPKDVRPYMKLVKTDLDSDETIESIELNSESDLTLKIQHESELLWQGIPAHWKPWKMDIADVDGDGKKEIIVGVFKSTKFFPKPHNCLFVYGWSGKKAYSKWLGSSLGRVFTDFLFADLDNKTGDELIALETTLEGKKSLAIYKWNGFGFTMIQQQGHWQTAKLLGVNDGQISIDAGGERIFIKQNVMR